MKIKTLRQVLLPTLQNIVWARDMLAKTPLESALYAQLMLNLKLMIALYQIKKALYPNMTKLCKLLNW